MSTNKIRSGKKVSSSAGKLLGTKHTAKKVKSIAGSVIVNRKKKT